MYIYVRYSYTTMYNHVTLYELQGYKKLKDKPEYVPLANQFFQRASPVQKHPDNGFSQILFAFPEIANSIKKREREIKKKSYSTELFNDLLI